MPGTFEEVNCVSPTPTTSSADGTQDSRDFKEYSGRSWSRDSRSSSALDRRSESSDSLDNHSTSSGHGRHLRDFGSTEFIPTRSTKSSAKPAYNPMQFVKTGPAKLVLTAQEQLKKAEEMKKIREKKRDESEDWQSNLEGWKSNRRKRQEHVIERVTEVKRMEQEEALRASEAAAKRLMEMREKRGKLMALYSTEDNDEIEFGNINAVSEEKSPKDQENGNFNDHIVNTLDQAASHSHKSHNEEYTYDKAIEDYVKYTNTALSKNEVTEFKNSEMKSSKTSSSNENKELVIKRSQKIEEKTQALLENRKPNEQRERKSISPENGDALVKRRSMFERATSSEEKEHLRANRRSGEFSSTFKNRLSNFELAPSGNNSTRVTPNRDPEFKNKLASFQSTESLVERRPSPTKGEEENDTANFKAKLAAFRKAELPASVPPTRKSIERQVNSKPLENPPESLDVKTESMNQLEVPSNKEQEIISSVGITPLDSSVHPPKSEEIKLERDLKPEPISSKPKPIPPTPLPKPESLVGKPKVLERKISLPKTILEPIYANTTTIEQPIVQKSLSDSTDSRTVENDSVVLNKPSILTRTSEIGLPDDRQIVPVYDEIISRPAEESDCTEDEGIRSLSPHGTQSPTSPTNIEADSIQPEPMTFPAYYPIHSQVNQVILSKDSLDSMEDKTDSGHVSYPVEDVSYESATQSSEVWGASDWLVGEVQNVSPPSEKPPPPPSDEDQQTDFQQIRNRGSDLHHRKELRKRRSDFLGFEVDNFNDITTLEASAIPPPPDLKSLLRNSDLRTGEVPMFADMEIRNDLGKTISDEDELARKEREIIEILEKEEYEQLHSELYSSDSPDGVNHGNVLQGIEYEMTAEIDQLAREWQGKKVNSSLKNQPKSMFPSNRYKEQNVETAISSTVSTSLEMEPVKPMVQEQSVPNDIDAGLTRPYISNKPRYQEPESSNKRLSEMNSTDGGHFQGIATSKPVSQEKESVRRSLPPLVQHRQETEGHPVSFPIKPSRLSAAPKPRLHDGESWMAKRKVAVEGQRKEKDISRHWLIQEAEQRRIDAMQERNQVTPERNFNTNTAPSQWASMPSVAPTRNITVAPAAQPEQWLPRSSSSTSMDKVPESRLQSKDYSRSTSSLASSPTPRPLYANQEEILEYADFTNAETGPQVWQVRSLNSGSMDHLQNIVPPARPSKIQSKSVTHLAQPNSTQTQPTWRSTQPPEMDKEPIAPLPHSVIHTLTQRVAQKNNANYGDYMNIQEATMPSRAAPQVPAQRPVNYRHSPLTNSQSVPGFTSNPQAVNNNDRMLSVSGKKKCSLCQAELGRGAAMIIESLRLFYHIGCFQCCVCRVPLGNGTAGTDVRVRNNHLHCHDCYSNDEGLKFSKV